jgi:hypothetical protein
VIRVRYSRYEPMDSTNTILVSKQEFVAGSDLVEIFIKKISDKFTAGIRKVNTSVVMLEVESTNLNFVKKMIKEKLVGLGVNFEEEVRISKKIKETNVNTLPEFSYEEPTIESAPY